MKTFKLKPLFSDEIDVVLSVYALPTRDAKSIRVALFYDGADTEKERAAMTERVFCYPWADVTVELMNVRQPKEWEAYIDTNNSPGMENFLQKNNLAEPTGYVGRSGMCVYPMYRFNKEALMEAAPEETKAYEDALNKLK